MHDDDGMVGRLLSRRELVALLGMSGVAALAAPAFGRNSGAAQAGAVPGCVVQPEQTEGPYFVDKMLDRSDITAGRPGVPLRLTLNVTQVGGDGRCIPLPGAHVDVWHCDALGVYSGVRDRSFDTVGETYLRGYQVTDERGAATFATIYPGWYPGRAVHIHFKVRTSPAAERGHEFTSQLYFDEGLTDRVFAQEPYSTKSGQRQRNERDGICRNGGKQLMLQLADAAGGYAGSFDLALHVPRA